MADVRKPAVAGTFYPGNPWVLSETVEKFVNLATVEDTVPKAIIAPHAGYVYSGSIAGTAYAFLKNGENRFQRIILLGPSHRVPLRGIAASSAKYFETPLGKIPVDTKAVARILDLESVQILDAAHAEEHSLEVQLPFLQCVLNSFTIVPLVAGDVSAKQLSSVLNLLADDEQTAIVVSSDLSHYLEYNSALEIDLRTSQLIENFKIDELSPEQACGMYPVRGLLHYAQAHGLKAKTVHLANSGDTAGSRDNVVGYGAYIFA